MKTHCDVCRAPASGYNFSGFTCFSCKIFFYRYAKSNKFTCTKGNCEINFQNRKCKKCRIVKCFSIGMKSELINSKYTKKQKSSDTIQFKWSNYEKQLIDEVQRSMAVFVDERKQPIVKNATNILQVFNSHGQLIQKIVKFCKGIKAFQELPNENDKLIILKQFYCDIITIRVSFNYDAKQDGFPYIESNSSENTAFMKLSLLKQSPIPQSDAVYRKFFDTLHTELESDQTMRNLLITFRLFNHRNGLSCPELIRYQQFKYKHLLLRYVEQKFGSLAKRKYNALMQLMNELNSVNELTYKLALCYDSKEFIEVINEIFGLTNN